VKSDPLTNITNKVFYGFQTRKHLFNIAFRVGQLVNDGIAITLVWKRGLKCFNLWNL